MKFKKIMVLCIMLCAGIPSMLMAKENIASEQNQTTEVSLKQPSFINAGNLNKNEHAIVIWADMYVLPPMIMASYLYGVTDWFDCGIDAGGSKGMTNASLSLKMKILKSNDERVFWGFNVTTGYQYLKVNYTNINPELRYDDNSWIIIPETTFAIRLGKERNYALYIKGGSQIDIDLRKPQRQTDYYIQGLVGFETSFANHANFFLEGGLAYSFTGWETRSRKFGFNMKEYMYRNAWYGVFKLGFAYRFNSQ